MALSVTRHCPPDMAARTVWSIDQFILAKKLGGGYASTVHLAVCKQTGIQVAIKVYHRSKLSQLNHYQVKREIRIHSCLHHPYVLQLYAAFEDESAIYLISEYASKGDVFAELDRRGGSMSEGDAVRLVLQPFLSALTYLHRLNIIHRDIKPENLLCTANGTLKVADFGLSIDVTLERPVTRVGTLDYMAPEVVVCPDKVLPGDHKDKSHLYYSCLVDSWAVGVLAYELTVGRAPFAAGSKRATIELILKSQPRFPAWISEPARHFVLWALGKHAAKRPTVQQLAAHPWISSHAKVPAALPLRQLFATRAGSAHDLCLMGAAAAAAGARHHRGGGAFAPLPEASSDEEGSCAGGAAGAWDGGAASVGSDESCGEARPPTGMFGSASGSALAAMGAGAPARLAKSLSVDSVDALRAAAAEPVPLEPSFSCFEPGGRMHAAAAQSTAAAQPSAPPPAAPAGSGTHPAASARPAPHPATVHAHHDSASSLASMVGELKHSGGSGTLTPAHSLTLHSALQLASPEHAQQQQHAAAHVGLSPAGLPTSRCVRPVPPMQLARMPSGASPQHSCSGSGSRRSSGSSSTATSAAPQQYAGPGAAVHGGSVRGSANVGLQHSDSCRSLTQLGLSVMPKAPPPAVPAASTHGCHGGSTAATAPWGHPCGDAAANVSATATAKLGARQMFDSPSSLSPLSRGSHGSAREGSRATACSSTGSAASTASGSPKGAASSCNSDSARGPEAHTPTHYMGGNGSPCRAAHRRRPDAAAALAAGPGSGRVNAPCAGGATLTLASRSSELRQLAARHAAGRCVAPETSLPAVLPVTCRRSASPPVSFVGGGAQPPPGQPSGPGEALHRSVLDVRHELGAMAHAAAGAAAGAAAARPLSCFSFLSSWRPALDLPPP